MKVIFLSGLKGGTGKTTLAVHLCNYIHFYERKTVCLVSFDRQRILSLLARENSSPYQVMETTAEEFGKGFLESLDQQCVVVDFPGTSVEKAMIQHWELADIHVLPFLSSALDFYKLLAFFQLATKRNLQIKQVFLLPNQYCKKAGLIMLENIRKQPIFSSSTILPPIIKSNRLISIDFIPLDITNMNYVRPSFINFINNK